MRKSDVPNDVLDKLAASLAELISAKEIYRSPAVMHVRSQQEYPIDGWLEVAKDHVSAELQDYNVLHEYPTGNKHVKFTNHGKPFVNTMLAEKFGGCVSNSCYWILYNEPLWGICNYGYKGDKLPTAKEIIRFIEEIYD